MKVELTVHASKLQNVAGLGKGTSDPYAVVTQIATSQGQKPHVVGKTEGQRTLLIRVVFSLSSLEFLHPCFYIILQ